MVLELPVRFTGESENQAAFTTLTLDLAKTAFLLVDCIYNDPESGVGRVLSQNIAPTLAAIRSAGMMAVFVYGGDHTEPRSIDLELHETRRGRTPKEAPWPPPIPQWFPGVEPQAEEPVILKRRQNGFRESGLDYHLHNNYIETLLCVGFSFKSCLFYTLVGAAEHNYRVVFLRDGTHPPGENEFPDTVNQELPEKGWVRLVLTRLIEDHLGYSSTCAELIQACKQVDCNTSRVSPL